MTCRAKWGYKGSGKVLRPWITHLLVKQDLKQKAQKVQVLQNVCGPRADGSLVKELTDGQVYIKAVFTAGCLNTYYRELEEEDSSPPSIDDALLILLDYHVRFMPNQTANLCEFVILVDKFTVWSYQQGFSRKTSPLNSMDDGDVKKRIDDEWQEWLEMQRENNPQVDTMDSVPLTQLLEEMGQADTPNMEMDQSPAVQSEPTEIAQKDPDSSNYGSRRAEKIVSLSENMCLEDFVVTSEDEIVLAAIEEWQSDYEPPSSPRSFNSSRKDSAELSEISAGTLKERKQRPSNRLEKENQNNKDIDSCGENNNIIRNTTKGHRQKDTARRDDRVDAEIQVSQSLWENYPSHRKQRTRDIAIQTIAFSQEFKKNEKDKQGRQVKKKRHNDEEIDGNRQHGSASHSEQDPPEPATRPTEEDLVVVPARSSDNGSTKSSSTTSSSQVPSSFSASFENFVLENYGESIQLSCSPNDRDDNDEQTSGIESNESFVTCPKSPSPHRQDPDDHFQSTQTPSKKSLGDSSRGLTLPDFDMSPVKKNSSRQTQANKKSQRYEDLVVLDSSYEEFDASGTKVNESGDSIANTEDAPRTIVNESADSIANTEDAVRTIMNESGDDIANTDNTVRKKKKVPTATLR